MIGLSSVLRPRQHSIGIYLGSTRHAKKRNVSHVILKTPILFITSLRQPNHKLN